MQWQRWLMVGTSASALLLLTVGSALGMEQRLVAELSPEPEASIEALGARASTRGANVEAEAEPDVEPDVEPYVGPDIEPNVAAEAETVVEANVETVVEAEREREALPRDEGAAGREGPADDEGDDGLVLVPDLSRVRADRARRRLRALGLGFRLRAEGERVAAWGLREYGVRSESQRPAAGARVEPGTEISARGYYIMSEAIMGY